MQKNIVTFLTLFLFIGAALTGLSQNRPTQPSTPGAQPSPTTSLPAQTLRAIPKPYKEVITDKAHTDKGLFLVHRVGDKWYFSYL